MPLNVRALLEPWTPSSRERAVGALGAANSIEASAELVALSRDTDPSIRAAALRLAADVAPTLGDELALASLADSVCYVRYWACEALLLHSRCDQAAGLLAALLVREPDEGVRYKAACALGYLGNRSHLPQLEAAWVVETGTIYHGTPIRETIEESIVAIQSRCPPYE